MRKFQTQTDTPTITALAKIFEKRSFNSAQLGRIVKKRAVDEVTVVKDKFWSNNNSSTISSNFSTTSNSKSLSKSYSNFSKEVYSKSLKCFNFQLFNLSRHQNN